jgi:hypothetical protein
MKALKTIVATAVIVLAFTTVAMAGVRHVGSWGDPEGTAAGPAAPQTHQDAGVTLTDRQFARLLQAANGHAAKLHGPKAGNGQTSTFHTRQADRDTSRDRARDRDHSRQKAGDPVMQVQAKQRAQTHDGGGTHLDGGTHDGGSHHGDGTHDGGFHHE